MPSQVSPTGGSSTALFPNKSRYLLARARLGDSTALGELVGSYLPWLRRAVHGRLPRWVRMAADTSDLIQDALLGTIRRRGALEIRDQRALGAYLYRAVQNRLRDEHRRFARRGMHQVSLELVDRMQPSLECTMAHDRLTRYHTALARLAPRDRELIVAHVELGYSHEQLGCMIGRSRNAARMALHRAIRRLLEGMGEA